MSHRYMYIFYKPSDWSLFVRKNYCTILDLAMFGMQRLQVSISLCSYNSLNSGMSQIINRSSLRAGDVTWVGWGNMFGPGKCYWSLMGWGGDKLSTVLFKLRQFDISKYCLLIIPLNDNNNNKRILIICY